VAQAGQHQHAGQVARRAEQAARTITAPDAQAPALTAVARALAQAGQHQQAEQVARRAEQVARTFTNPYRHAQALIAVAQVLARERVAADRRADLRDPLPAA
jgi:hypothetical protein